MNHAGACTAKGPATGVRGIAVMRGVGKQVPAGPGARNRNQGAWLARRLVDDLVDDYSTTVAFSITTSSSGTSWWKPELPVRTPLIWSTTSVPSTTLPNTA